KKETLHGTAGQISRGTADALRRTGRAGVSRRPDLPRAIHREEFRLGVDQQPSLRIPPEAFAAHNDCVALGEAALPFAGWISAVSVRARSWFGPAWASAKAGFGRSSVHAERKPPDDLHFDAGRVRGRLPVL